METARPDYPDFAFYNAMNSLGTHDLRILTYLVPSGGSGPRNNGAGYVMSGEERRRGTTLLEVGHHRTVAFQRATIMRR